MNTLVPDISHHELLCKEHQAKAQAYCPALECENRLFCFACICRKSNHSHSIDNFDNIINLFKAPKEQSYVSNEKICELSTSISDISQKLEQKVEVTVKKFKNIIEQLRDASQLKARLESLNSTKGYIQSLQERLNGYYRSCNFPKKNSKIAGLDSRRIC